MKDPKNTVMTCTNLEHQMELFGHELHHTFSILLKNGSSKVSQALAGLSLNGTTAMHGKIQKAAAFR